MGEPFKRIVKELLITIKDTLNYTYQSIKVIIDLDIGIGKYDKLPSNNYIMRENRNFKTLMLEGVSILNFWSLVQNVKDK